MFHCFFEQSGTFKNEFKKLGFQAEDYDILNDFNETDHVIDLYKEIDAAFEGGVSIFDKINPTTDQIIAFFPCVRFEQQIVMKFNGSSWEMQQRPDKWTEEVKLKYSMQLHTELHDLYMLISKMVLVCIERKIPLIIENPYHETHYLWRYWPIRPKVIDRNRRDTGDYYKKPTQYYFINREPSNNFVFEGTEIKYKKIIDKERGAERSMISPDYANRFIREFIISETEFEKLKERED